MKTGVVGLIGAMDVEVKNLIEALEDRQTVQVADTAFHFGRVGAVEVVVMRCGIGKVNAARGAQMMIDRFHPDVIINTGIAGGIEPGLRVGDIVIGTGLVQHDFDVTGFGYVRGYLFTGDGTKPSIFTPDPEWVNLLEAAAMAMTEPARVKRGLIATGDVFVSTAEKKEDIWENFHASAAEMEGGAIGQTAAYSHVPFAVLRVLSDQADGQAADSYDTFEAETAKLSSEILLELLRCLP